MKNVIVINAEHQVINVVVFADNATEELMLMIYPGCTFIETLSLTEGVYYDIGTYYNPADGLFYADSEYTIIATPPAP